MAFFRIGQAYQKLAVDEPLPEKNITIEKGDTACVLLIRIDAALANENQYDVVEFCCEQKPLLDFLESEEKDNANLEIGLLLSNTHKKREKMPASLNEKLAYGSVLMKNMLINKHFRHANFEKAYDVVFKDKKLHWLCGKDESRPVDFDKRRPVNSNDLRAFLHALTKKN